MKAQDTSELFFDNVAFDPEHLLGGEAWKNKGFICLMQELPWERCKSPSCAWPPRRPPLMEPWTT